MRTIYIFLTFLCPVLALSACENTDASSDGGMHSNCDFGYQHEAGFDSGNGGDEVDSGDSNFIDEGYPSDGGIYISPKITQFETQNNSTLLPQNMFSVGETVRFFGRAEDPDCDATGKCGGTSGIMNCRIDWPLGLNTLQPNENGEVEYSRAWGTPDVYKVTLRCKDFEEHYSDISKISFTVTN